MINTDVFHQLERKFVKIRQQRLTNKWGKINKKDCKDITEKTNKYKGAL